MRGGANTINRKIVHVHSGAVHVLVHENENGNEYVNGYGCECVNEKEERRRERERVRVCVRRKICCNILPFNQLCYVFFTQILG